MTTKHTEYKYSYVVVLTIEQSLKYTGNADAPPPSTHTTASVDTTVTVQAMAHSAIEAAAAVSRWYQRAMPESQEHYREIAVTAMLKADWDEKHPEDA